jgi:hypothetical protein
MASSGGHLYIHPSLAAATPAGACHPCHHPHTTTTFSQSCMPPCDHALFLLEGLVSPLGLLPATCLPACLTQSSLGRQGWMGHVIPCANLVTILLALLSCHFHGPPTCHSPQAGLPHLRAHPPA